MIPKRTLIWLQGALIGMMLEYMYRVKYSIYPFVGVILCFILTIILVSDKEKI